MNIKPQVNEVFPTDASLDACWHRFRNSLPIKSENDLFTLFMIHHNTVITELGKKDNETK